MLPGDLCRGGGTPDTKMAARIASDGFTHSRACATNASRNIAEDRAVAARTSAPNTNVFTNTTLPAEITALAVGGVAPHNRAGGHNPGGKKGGLLWH